MPAECAAAPTWLAGWQRSDTERFVQFQHGGAHGLPNRVKQAAELVIVILLLLPHAAAPICSMDDLRCQAAPPAWLRGLGCPSRPCNCWLWVRSWRLLETLRSRGGLVSGFPACARSLGWLPLCAVIVIHGICFHFWQIVAAVCCCWQWWYCRDEASCRRAGDRRLLSPAGCSCRCS